MTDLHSWALIAVIALVTAALRFLPFVVFRRGKTPRLIDRLGHTLPYAIMGILVVYCLRGTSLTSLSGILPSLIACLVVGSLYVWKRNTLISIVSGTVCYMLLVQWIF